MEIRILGPLEVAERGRTIPLGPAKERALLVSLAVHANEVVSRFRLIEELWGDDPPDTAPKMVQLYVSHLRKLLEREAVAGASLVTHAPGYVLRIDPDALDANRFERLAAAGKQALAQGAPGEASRLVRDALALWRGRALAEFEAEPFAATEAARLEELRLTAIEDRVEADLARGRHADVIAELEALTAEHPLRERLRGQLMLALYRSGRQAEALDVYQRTRTHLVEELGIEPSRPLQELERRILAQAAELDAPAVSSATGGAPPLKAKAARKPVSVLLAEIVRVGRAPDPEALAPVVARAVEAAATVARRHGAAVETSARGEIMAVFGIPVVHEDDALRALRAAVQIRDRIDALSRELEPRWSARLAVRAGVSTGEIVVGETNGNASGVGGEPVDAAARLVHASPPGEIAIGPEVERLVRHGAVVEPLRLAGSPAGSSPRPAWRLRAVVAGVPAVARRRDAPMVGRENELAWLVELFRRAVHERRSRLVSVIGPAGVGKSRLVEEFAAALAEEATALNGRCISSGEGTTFAPLAEIVEQATGARSRDAIAALLAAEPEGELQADRVAAAIGLAERAGPKEETFWAVRGLFRTLASQRPLVLVFDELHWAEPTLLDLVEHVVDWSGDAAILVVGVARPELLEERPSWGGARPSSTMLRLEPLSAEESDMLLRSLVGGAALTDEARARIVAAAEGNPLFIEQMLAMLSEEEGAEGEPTVPPTLQALLAARIDRLRPGERETLERAAVIGREFWRGAVRELTPPGERDGLDADLDGLIGRELVAATRAPFPGEEGFVFRHVLIREAVYDSIPKHARARLHERAAALLDRLPGERAPDRDETVGFHLEQAYRYREELALLEEADDELALRAAERLGAAGRRAYALGDLPAAIGLLSRAASLVPVGNRARPDLLIDLGEALRERGDFGDAQTALDEAIETAEAAGDAIAEAHARLIELRARAQVSASVAPEDFLRLGDEAIALFEEARDERRLAKAWFIRAWGPWVRGRVTEAELALRRSIAYARRVGDERTEAQAVNLFVGAGFFGPTPVPEASRRCEEILARPREQQRVVAPACRALAGLRAMEGDFAGARRLARRDRKILERLGLRVAAAMATEVYGLVELLAGDPAAAERELRSGCKTLEEMGETSILPNLAAMLAQALYAQGRDGEALEASAVAERAASSDDISSQVQWRAARGKVLARTGSPEEGLRFADEAVALAGESPDFPLLRADALVDRAEVLRLRDRPEEARASLEEALVLYERKGNVVAAGRVREHLGGLHADAAAAPVTP